MMTRHWLWALGVAVLSPLSAAPAAPADPRAGAGEGGGYFDKVDALLGQSEAGLKKLEEEAAQSVRPRDFASLPECLRQVTTVEAIERLLRYGDTGSSPPLLPPLPDYLLCMAVAHNEAGRCDAVKKFDSAAAGAGSQDPYARCLGHYYEFKLRQAVMTRSPQAAQVCMAAMRTQDSFATVKPGREQDFCSALARHSGDPRKACETIAPLLPSGESARCEEGISSLTTLKECFGTKRGAGDWMAAVGCPELVAFQKALRSRDPKACGNGSFCRALMGGGPSSCAAYGRALAQAYCPLAMEVNLAARASEASRGFHERGKAVLYLLDQAHMTLEFINSRVTPMTAQTATEIDSRVEKETRLRLRYERLSAALQRAARPPRSDTAR